ncbi:MAG: TRAFAC clade GTPase domain-containing protein [Planctomycetota bacterium]|jgi:hypothetical protein
MVNSDTQEQTLPKYEDINSSILRDRIVILGRQGAGKTVYLSLLYELLWKSKGDLSMKTLKGRHHREFIKAVTNLRKGKWPGPTSSNQQAFIEINYKGQQRLMVAMDYSGELINKAFILEEETNEVQELLEHLDNAAGVILIIDPADVAGIKANLDSSVENSFGIVQAVGRLRRWPGGDKVPVVLVLSKLDKNLHLMKNSGGTAPFVQKYFPELISTVKNLQVCKISAVQASIQNGNAIKSNFKPVNLEPPLRYCLDIILENERNSELAQMRQKNVQETIQRIKRQTKRDRIIGWCMALVLISAVFSVLYYIIVTLWPIVLQKFLPLSY